MQLSPAMASTGSGGRRVDVADVYYGDEEDYEDRELVRVIELSGK